MDVLMHVADSSGWAVYVFIAAWIFLGASILFFRSIVLFAVQLLVVLLWIFMGANPVMGMVLAIAQIALSLYMLYRLVKAVDYNYQLVIEKTHEIPPNITKTGNGSRSVF